MLAVSSDVSLIRCSSEGKYFRLRNEMGSSWVLWENNDLLVSGGGCWQKMGFLPHLMRNFIDASADLGFHPFCKHCCGLLIPKLKSCWCSLTVFSYIFILYYLPLLQITQKAWNHDLTQNGLIVKRLKIVNFQLFFADFRVSGWSQPLPCDVILLLLHRGGNKPNHRIMPASIS